jgi:hypothetical protein
VQEIAAELTCVDFAVWCHLTAPHFSEVWAERGQPCDSLSFTDFSWHHFDTHNSRVLRLGALHLWNSCVAVTDCVFVNSSTAAVPCCYDQHSISSKLQILLYMMTVSREALLSQHSDFQISKTIIMLSTHPLLGNNIQQDPLNLGLVYMTIRLKFYFWHPSCINMTEKCESITIREKRFHSFPWFPNWLWGPPSLQASGSWGSLLGIEWPGLEADHSPPSSAKFKNVWICVSMP